ncbi:LacI family DNA-binding transcriptional regulator [Comamonas aquatica]|uniref:LacI family DNA-binding transcriptional regulator n=1 Tax=Comamonas aquatica TaxID=225991 RepID=UPI002449C2CE|nr:substrate-binding domain-containing protein [Comamonas aquatica]MDH1675961.1 substrate-binding domain-containing protein [Comamonas aquatica]MDH1679577.1 substrate-binding domain-containing protein [Comamonas aquatica]
MSKLPSVRDVAAAAGVSIASVSRALNGSGPVSGPMRERIAQAVCDTGYTPNFSAKHLRIGRSKTIGLMVSNIANPFMASIFAATERHLHRAGFSVLAASTYNDPQREQELLLLYENRRLEGLIAYPAREGVPRAQNPFAHFSLPLVVIDREIDYDCDTVFMDHRSGVRQAVDYLCTLGHRRIALLGPNEALRPGREKLLGWQDALVQRGIDPDPRLVCMLKSAIDPPEEQMAEMLRLPAPPTALVALGMHILSGALRVVRRAGLRIPRDFSVIGIGTPEVFAMAETPLTTLRFNLDQQARLAADLMLERLGGYNGPRRSLTVPLDLVLGESCAAPRAITRKQATEH